MILRFPICPNVQMWSNGLTISGIEKAEKIFLRYDLLLITDH